MILLINGILLMILILTLHYYYQDARQDEHKCKDNEIYHSILEARNHKLRMEKR